MFVDPCIIVQFIQKNPTRCNSVSIFIISYSYEAQHVSGDTPLIIRSLKLQPLVLHTWKVVGLVVAGSCQAEYHSAWQHGCLSLVGVVSFQVQVSALGRSPFQRSPTDCRVSYWVWSRNLHSKAACAPSGAVAPYEKKNTFMFSAFCYFEMSSRNVSSMLLCMNSYISQSQSGSLTKWWCHLLNMNNLLDLHNVDSRGWSFSKHSKNVSPNIYCVHYPACNEPPWLAIVH